LARFEEPLRRRLTFSKLGRVPIGDPLPNLLAELQRRRRCCHRRRTSGRRTSGWGFLGGVRAGNSGATTAYQRSRYGDSAGHNASAPTTLLHVTTTVVRSALQEVIHIRRILGALAIGRNGRERGP
jgi:hypothetical protein